MFFLICYLIFTKILCTAGSNAGSALFYNRLTRSECWNQEDIAKLRARRLFEQLIPSPVTPERINSKYIRDTLRYFRQAFNTVEQYEDQHTSVMLKEALADTIGAHLRSEVLPTARFAYYAGYVPYIRVRELHDFYEDVKTILNSQGLGWKAPPRVPQWTNLTVSKILIGNGKYFDSCGCLVMKRDASSCIHLPLPKLDDQREPSAVALPLRSGGLVSLTSPGSDNIFLKYYTTASRCILNSSPATCRHTDFFNFNNEMWHWMKRNVSPRLGNEKLYAAFGGILRIAAAVQSYGKGLTRRNLFESEARHISKWHPWKAVKESYASVNDWSPYIYVGIVLLAALSICLMQICFNFISGDEDGCGWRSPPKESVPKDVSYADVESNIPAMLPSHQNVYYSEEMRLKRPPLSNVKTMSLGSLRTQKVYDLNENAEKVMTVLSEEEGSSNSTSSNGRDPGGKSASDGGRRKRSPSPPKIDSATSQVQLPKRSKKPKQVSMTTVTRSDGSESERSGSESSRSSSCSASSGTSNSRHRNRRCRNIDWARKVVSQHTLQRKTTTGTEVTTTTPTFTGLGSDSVGYYFN